ncbi:MAG: energy-coupling factor transporter ATPase [Eubacteriales bacterium]
MEPILRTENLTHTYSISTPFEKVAVNDVSIDIFAGEYIGVIGQTGSGKSTLIQHLNGLLKPTSGKIFFNGMDCWEKGFDLRQLRFNVGLVFQYPEYQLFEETVEKDISYGPKNMGLDENEIHRRVLDAIRFVGLDESVLERSPFEFSGGQKRRIAIAGIMAMKPKVLILDEPTAGLDPRGRDEILARIREYREQEKATVMLVSHSMDDIARNAEKVLVINKAKVAMFAPVNDVFEHSRELRDMGLNVPQITRVFLDMKAHGYDVDPSVYTPEQACSQILRLIGERGNV